MVQCIVMYFKPETYMTVGVSDNFSRHVNSRHVTHARFPQIMFSHHDERNTGLIFSASLTHSQSSHPIEMRPNTKSTIEVDLDTTKNTPTISRMTMTREAAAGAGFPVVYHCVLWWLCVAAIQPCSLGFSPVHNNLLRCDRGPSPLEAWSGSSRYMDNLSAYTEYSYHTQQPPQQRHVIDEQEELTLSSVTHNVNVQQPSPHAQEMALALDTKQQQLQLQAAEEERIMQQQQDDRYLQMVATEVDVKKFLGQNPYAWTDIPVRRILQRVLDNLEDSLQKTNGKVKGKSLLRGADIPADDRPTVVVLGTGWAAHAFVKLASTYDLRVVVVSPVNHFCFTPMLASAAVGTVEYRSMTEPIRVTNPFIDNFVEGRAIGLDVDQQKVHVRLTSLATVTGVFKGLATAAPDRLEPESDIQGGAGRVITLTYDYLLCAVGTSVRSSIVPGAKENCFNLKTSQDAKRLRTAIGEALEYVRARRLPFASFFPFVFYVSTHTYPVLWFGLLALHSGVSS